MARVIAYVDGFNLYFGLKNAGFKRLYWLDVSALAGNLLKPGQTLAATHYFTARIRDNGRNTADRKRQGDYLEALGLSGTSIQLGHYLEKQRSCRKCHAAWTDYEEKMTAAHRQASTRCPSVGRMTTGTKCSVPTHLSRPVLA